MFLKHFETLLDKIPNDGEGWTIVDAFGGSGLLSHVAKRLKPKATVIFAVNGAMKRFLGKRQKKTISPNQLAQIVEMAFG